MKYDEKATEVKEALTQICDAMDELADKMITAAFRYEELDNAF